MWNLTWCSCSSPWERSDLHNCAPWSFQAQNPEQPPQLLPMWRQQAWAAFQSAQWGCNRMEQDSHVWGSCHTLLVSTTLCQAGRKPFVLSALAWCSWARDVSWPDSLLQLVLMHCSQAGCCQKHVWQQRRTWAPWHLLMRCTCTSLKILSISRIRIRRDEGTEAVLFEVASKGPLLARHVHGSTSLHAGFRWRQVKAHSVDMATKGSNLLKRFAATKCREPLGSACHVLPMTPCMQWWCKTFHHVHDHEMGYAMFVVHLCHWRICCVSAMGHVAYAMHAPQPSSHVHHLGSMLPVWCLLRAAYRSKTAVSGNLSLYTSALRPGEQPLGVATCGDRTFLAQKRAALHTSIGLFSFMCLHCYQGSWCCLTHWCTISATLTHIAHIRAAEPNTLGLNITLAHSKVT